MNITFVSKGKLSDFVISDMPKIKAPDVLVFSNKIIEKLDLIEEIDGKTSVFYELCKISENLGCVLIVGCDTEVLGILHKSAIIIDSGTLIGVSDMAHILDDSKYNGGGCFRVYDTSKGKIGLVVGDDILFPEVLRTLALCDSDIIISVYGKIHNAIPQVMMRAASYFNGINICMAAEGYVQISDIKGEIICALDSSIFEFSMEIVKDYHLIQARRRGFYKEIYSSFTL